MRALPRHLGEGIDTALVGVVGGFTQQSLVRDQKGTLEEGYWTLTSAPTPPPSQANKQPLPHTPTSPQQQFRLLHETNLKLEQGKGIS